MQPLPSDFLHIESDFVDNMLHFRHLHLQGKERNNMIYNIIKHHLLCVIYSVYSVGCQRSFWRYFIVTLHIPRH